MIRTTIAACTALVLAAPLAGQVEDPQVTLSGFVNATLFAQDQSFGYGNGQSALWAMPDRIDRDRWFTGGDVRNTRLRVSLDQVVAEGVAVRAIVEADFFGAFNGSGPFSDEQPQPRLRVAQVDLMVGRNTLRFGQMFTPLWGAVPVSLSHIAFPPGLGSGGLVGWRHPGVLIERRLDDTGPTTMSVQVGAFRGSWSGPGDNLNQQSAGEAASVPQLEARLDVRHAPEEGFGFSAYFVGHYDRKDLDGVGIASDAMRELEGFGLQLGGTIDWGPATVRGNAYTGRALGQQFAQLGQFGDISGWGGWVQPGVQLSDRWDVFLFVGYDDPSDDDLVREVPGARRLRNRSTAGMLRYSIGPYALAAEVLNARTEWGESDGPVLDWWTASARQLSLSMLYRF